MKPTVRAFLAISLVLLAEPPGRAAEEQPDQPRVVIPFDFESTFDEGRYGRMVGEMVWKKLERQGGFVIPESMLDVRDVQQRRNLVPNHATPLDQVQTMVRDDFGGHIGIWGKVERVAGHEWDVYDVWILIADFAHDKPHLIHQAQTRTRTVSEIPHVYVKEALDALYGRGPEPVAGPNPDAERRWRESPNLLNNGGFERGSPGPTDWDPLPPYVRRVAVPAENGNRENQVLRFQFPASVADTTGVLFYSNFFPVVENAQYRFQCRYRTSGSQVKVFIKCYDEVGTEYAQRTMGSGAAYERREVYRSQQNLKGPKRVWNVHTEDFTPQHSQFVPTWGRVMLYAYHPAGTVDFDDVIVRQIQPPPPNQPPKTRRPSLETNTTTREIDNAKNKQPSP